MHSNLDELIGSASNLLAERGVKFSVREIFSSGNSGAIVALVDCEGSRDGIFILKIDKIAVGWQGEADKHFAAQRMGAFKGSIPPIMEFLEANGIYLLLMRLAGDSRLTWRPLLESPRLFRIAYKKLAEILWSPDLFTLSSPISPRDCAYSLLGYRLQKENGGRIETNIAFHLGEILIKSDSFAYLDKVLPNPFAFAMGTIKSGMVPMIRTINGPCHGDCHAGNIFIRPTRNGEVEGLSLIDFAFYEDASLIFYDHAYLELSTLLSKLDGIGEQRWLNLLEALCEDGNSHFALEQHERAWVADIKEAREYVYSLARSDYEFRFDDMYIQFLLAEISAGLAFLNKTLRLSPVSPGLSTEQYRQAFIWSAVYLRKLMELMSLPVAASGAAVPRLGLVEQAVPASLDATWEEVKGFSEAGLNILIMSPRFRANVNPENLKTLFRVPWGVVVDFCPEYLDFVFQDLAHRSVREAWPNSGSIDFRLINRGTLWYFANGRADIAEALPTSSLVEWRRQYSGHFRHVVGQLAKYSQEASVRVLAIGEGADPYILQSALDAIDAQFGDLLKPIIVASEDASVQVPGLRLEQVSISLVLDKISATASPVPPAVLDYVAMPCRREGGTIVKGQLPVHLALRLKRDLLLVNRGLARQIPEGREFGIDFRRGMTIEWSELAADLDVKREKEEFYIKGIRDALGRSGNATVNLQHEPSAGGTTLSRRLAWCLMEEVPVVILRQLSSDTAELLRDLFHFCSLPLLVIMEAATVTESEREALLRQLREDNTRAVFLWVSRLYGLASAEYLPSRLTDHEAEIFLAAYIEQVQDTDRRSALQRLASSPSHIEQRSPFFFGLAAFGERFIGLDKLISETVDPLPEVGRGLLADLALVSFYSSDGFPVADYDELCCNLNDCDRPFVAASPFAVEAAMHIKIPHQLIAEKTLASLARQANEWKADLYLHSERLLDHLRKLSRVANEGIRKLGETLFITRDTKAALEGDADFRAGEISRQTRFSPLIEDIGNVELGRELLRKAKDLWPEEHHFAVHYARHLIYEQPREIDRALNVLEIVVQKIGDMNDVVIHMIGMCYRVRMEASIDSAKFDRQSFAEVEVQLKADCKEALDRFARAAELNPESEYGHVASIQTIAKLLRNAVELSGATSFGEFISLPGSRWCAELVTRSEESIAALRERPYWRLSLRARNTIAQWDLVYGKLDLVINRLRFLSDHYQDAAVRRALCDVIFAKYKRKWSNIPPNELRTVLNLLEANIQRQGVRDSDVRKWLLAFRQLPLFDLHVAVRRLIDWNSMQSSSVEPAFYLYVLYFLEWLRTSPKNEGLAIESNRWLDVCRENRRIGQRNWGYEWLTENQGNLSVTHFSELPFDPVTVLRSSPREGEEKMRLFPRVKGIMKTYKGPQQAILSLGHGLEFHFTPLDRMNRDDLGKRVSVIVAFTYDGPVGWDARLVEVS